MSWNELANEESIQSAMKALKLANIESMVAENAEEARKKILEIIPSGSEVLDSTSVTLETIGVLKELNESGKYDAVKPKIHKLDHKTQQREMQKLRSSPEWVIGSVHAVTEDGHVLIASNTGSQLAPYVYGAGHVLWVVGTQKIVKNIDEGMKRINDYIIPLEDKHMQQLYGVHTNLSKLLIINKEIFPGRITILFVKEVLGF